MDSIGEEPAGGGAQVEFWVGVACFVALIWMRFMRPPRTLVEHVLDALLLSPAETPPEP